MPRRSACHHYVAIGMPSLSFACMPSLPLANWHALITINMISLPSACPRYHQHALATISMPSLPHVLTTVGMPSLTIGMPSLPFDMHSLPLASSHCHCPHYHWHALATIGMPSLPLVYSRYLTVAPIHQLLGENFL